MLTEKQTIVIKKLASGMNIKTIAGEMELSAKTVEFHKAAACRKLKLRSDVEITHYGIARLGVPLMFAALLLLTPFARAGSVQLQWDYPPATNTTFVLYATTNATLTESNMTSAQVIADVGTNKTVLAVTTSPGQWKFGVTSKTNNVQSALSNILPIQVPVTPTNLITVMIQYSAVLEGLGSSPTNAFLKLLPVP